MTGNLPAIATGIPGCHLYPPGCGYPAPSLNDFYYKPFVTIAGFGVTKPELLSLICVVIIVGFFWAAFSRPKLVPGKLQSIGEMGILFVRDQILRPFLGRKGDKYLPFLISLFFFIWLMNLMEIIPVAGFPVTARSGFPWLLVGIVFVTYLYIGFRHQGPVGYFKNMIPRDVPWWILPLLFPVELLKYFFTQPFTLGVRLFANMFAGHILLLVFYLSTWYLASFSIGMLWAAGSLVMVFVITVFELLIEFLQAFIFTTLAATYIADSLGEMH